MIEIDTPSRHDADGQARLVGKIVTDLGTSELFFSVPVEYGAWLAADRCDGFVVGVLLQAMRRKADIHVHGPLSSKLFHNLTGFYVPMMAQAFDSLHVINIFPSVLTEDRTQGVGVCTGFSAGIDSFAAVVQHLVRETSTDHRISHFLFHNVGSHGHGTAEDDRRLFRQRHAQVEPFAREVNIPIVPVDSNLAEILPIYFIEMHSALNASIPLVLQNGFQRYYYASTYKYKDCGVSRTDDIARFDPLAFHLYSTEGLDCVSTGAQLSRVQKTQLIASYEPTRRYLNVCVDPAFEGRNCSICFKCVRTILTLELLGVADDYRGVFDFERFRKHRSRYLMRVVRSDAGSFEHEIAELFRQKGTGPFADAYRFQHRLRSFASRRHTTRCGG